MVPGGASKRRGGFTLLEVLTTLAFLVVVMGLMVSLARYVRTQSAQQYTRRLLAELQIAQQQYSSTVGADDSITLPPDPQESEVRGYAERIGPYVAALLTRLHPGEEQSAVRDAWGNAVAYLPHQNPSIGMASQNQPFFFSAGPDGRYLTRQDNLYSYEQLRSGFMTDLPAPVTSPAAGPLDSANNTPATVPSSGKSAGPHGTDAAREKP